MSRAKILAGVDGCRGGWVLASCEGAPGAARPRIAILKDFEELVRMTVWHYRVAVDMPIGLASGEKPRFCDVLAKEALPPGARSRVFMAPPRETLLAENPAEFQAMHLAARGRKAGIPVWGLMAKLRQVHEVMNPDLQRRIVEFHPELTWQRLSGRALSSKHKPEGIMQRLALLKGYMGDYITMEDLKSHSPAKPDDVLDALSGLFAAHACSEIADFDGFAENRLPPICPPRDSRGLRMEIWF